MRISLSWLAAYVPLPPAEELARRLTDVGLEVEAVERVGAAPRRRGGGPHPLVGAPPRGREALRLPGRGGSRAGAGGLRRHQLEGGRRGPAGHAGHAHAGRPPHRPGQASAASTRTGMLCSARELGLSEDASGLLILPGDAVPGTPLARVLGIEDVVLEVNVTPNRPDALSHLGIAREVAAATGAAVAYPESGPEAAGPRGLRRASGSPSRRRTAASATRRGSSRGSASARRRPGWPQRLEACGVRSISNVVDATNFVLLERGQPLHAFDLDKVAGAEIVVRMARVGREDGHPRRRRADALPRRPRHRRPRPRQRARRRHGRRRLGDLRGDHPGAARVGLVRAHRRAPHRAPPRPPHRGLPPLRARRRSRGRGRGARPLRGHDRRALRRHRPSRRGRRAPAPPQARSTWCSPGRAPARCWACRSPARRRAPRSSRSGSSCAPPARGPGSSASPAGAST